MSPVPGYWVTITNIITSCTITDTLEITEPDNLASVTSVISIPSCNGEDDASVIVEVSGGTIPYNYMWTNSAGTTVSTTNDSVAFNLVAGTYYVQVTDANNCIKLDSITITEPLPILANISADSTQCDGTGSAFATPTGGTAPYTYLWSGGTGANTDSTYLGLNSAITYFVTITDTNNCSLTSAAINIPSSVIITNSYNLSNYNGFNISCYDESDGSLTSITSGGSAPYEYVWNTGALTQDLTNLSAGTYNVDITDTNGCMATSSVTIDQPDQILSGLIVTNVTCIGENDGSASVNPGPDHDILWFDGTSNNLNVGPMSPANYWVTITNTTTFCTITDTFAITEPDTLASITSVISIPSCNGGEDASVIVSVRGGTIPYDYIWTNSAGNTVSTSNDSVAFNLSAGTYYVQVTDANNCIQTDSITITEVTIIMTNITFVNPSCSGGSDGIAITTPTGGTSPYTYLWSGGTGANTDSTYLGLNSSSNYNVTITDANNCTHTEDVNLPATGGITINYTLSNYNGFNVSCYDSANAIVTINALGGTPPYLYSEDGINYTNDPIFSNISAGLLTIYVKEFAGCVASTSIMITGPTSIIPNITIENILTCDGLNDGALLSEPIGGNPGSGGYAYQWSNSVTVDSISELNSGSYSVIVTDINLCTGYDTILLIPAYILSADAEELNPVSCYGFSDGSATINVSGATPPFNYSWNTGATTQTILAGLSFGQYWCTITDVSGCTITDTVDITQSPNSLTITSTEITDVSCNGGNDGEINITASGGTGGTYTTLWTPGGQTATTATALTSGTYSVAVTDNANCTVYDTLIVEEPTAMIMSSIISTDITCFGENDGIISTVVTGGTPGYTYLWSNNQIGDTITNLIQGTYYINVIDSNGCILIDSAIINESDPLISIISETNPLCHNDSNGIIDVICKGGIPPYLATYMSIPYTIADSNIVANITGLSAGTNTLYLTDDNGCNINTDITLTNPLELEVIKLAQIDPVCYNYATGVAEVTINGGISPYTYSWSDLQSTAKAIDLMSGNYNCTVTDINGCTDSTSFLLVNPFEIEILASVQDILCFGTSEGSISVNVENAIGNYEIFWQEDANDSIFIDNLLAGLYHVTIIDDNSCTKTDSILVNQTAEMVIDYTIYPTSCKDIEDGSIEINNIYGGTPPFNVYKNGELHTEGTYNSTNIENLASSDNGLPYIIKVIDNNNCEEDSNFMINYIGGYNCIDEPIIISPNYDGTNDVWQPVVDLDVDMEVSILNRWGELEYNYSGNSLLFIWDGVPENGGELPSADYYYIIKFKNNSYPTRTGALTLIR